MLHSSEAGLAIGSSILGLVTFGMYDNPLVVYREYIQNSVDALARTGGRLNGRIEITIDSPERRVLIRDNGPGLSYQECLEELLPIARSKKRLGCDRGFRGIGRLSGLAFAGSVRFLTRTRRCESVTRVVWSGVNLLDWADAIANGDDAVQGCISVDTLCGLGYPDHFFEVEIGGISRYAAGLLLNQDAVRSYISEVCPVPMALEFPFAQDVEKLFEPSQVPYSQEIILDSCLEPVRRQYGKAIRFAESREDQFEQFEEVRIPSVEGSEDAAVGWVAHSSYLGAIPKDSGIRGIRARVGNIQVGDETVFDHIFQEERFNRWCVGELHILDRRLVPNSKRDYFEPGPHLRNLENHLGSVFRRIATRCRSASAARNKEKRFLSELSQLEETCELVTSGYLAATDSDKLALGALEQVAVVRENLRTMGLFNGHMERLNQVEVGLRGLGSRVDSRLFRSLSPSEVSAYQKVFRALTEVSVSPRSAKRTIEAVLMRV